MWQIESRFPAPTNCWLIQDDNGLTLIDAGLPWSTQVILKAVHSIGQPLRRIVITHAHPDHAGAAGYLSALTGAEVFAHEADAPFLDGSRSMSDESGFWLSRMVLKGGDKLGVLDCPRIANVQPVEHGQMVGGLKVIHTPGHTPGSISLWSQNEKAVFCGDNLIYSLRVLRVGLPWFTLDHKLQSASLQQYVDLQAQILLSGHGPAFTGDVSAAVRRLL